MQNNILSEKEYQKYILERLSENGYEIKPASGYDRLFSIDREALPIYEDKYSVYYMWEDILQKDTLMELLGK